MDNSELMEYLECVEEWATTHGLQEHCTAEIAALKRIQELESAIKKIERVSYEMIGEYGDSTCIEINHICWSVLTEDKEG